MKKEELEISSNQSHYLSKVMRKKAGEQILVFNSKDGEWEAKILIPGKNMKVLPQKKTKKLVINNNIWVCFGIIKPRNNNFLIEKLSEIGVEKFIPMNTEFSQNLKLNYQRLEKIAMEATEQSNGMKIPIIEKTIYIKTLLSNWDQERTIIVCDERGESESLSKTLIEKTFSNKLAIFLGPVGGWSDNDIKLFKGKKSVFFVSLGERLLKADTAAIYALSCCNSILSNKK